MSAAGKPGGAILKGAAVLSGSLPPMRKPRIIRLRQPPIIAVTLLDGELDELIECVANAADRAESGSYDMAGTPKAKALAKERAKRLYALASHLERARQS
jgi:hypothetical protein